MLITESLLKKMTFEQIPGYAEGGDHKIIGLKVILGWENSKSKSSEMGISLVCLKNSKIQSGWRGMRGRKEQVTISEK